MNKAILAVGRLNPPTIGHELLIDTMAQQDGDAYLYLSHSQDSKKNPLSYEDKVHWCELAFGDRVNVPHSEARNMYEAAQELNEKGYTDLVYVCGSDRSEEAQRMLAYNGKPDKQGNIIYNFDSISFIKAGEDRVSEDIDITKVSASRQRQLAEDGDLEEFIQGCPSRLTEDECEELYNDVRKGMGLVESLEELHLVEATMEKPNILPQPKHDYYSMVLNDLSSKDKGVLMKDGEKYFIDDKKVLAELEKLKDETDYNNKVNKFHELTDLKWTDIEKSPYTYKGSNSSDSNIDFKKDTKTLAPVKVMNVLDRYMPLSKVSENIEFKDSKDRKTNEIISQLLRKVVSDCINNVRITSNKEVLDYMKKPNGTASSNNFSLYTEYDVKKLVDKLGYNIIEELRSPFKNNFGEVFGGASLSAALSDNTYIKFPGASNYPIADYIISNKPNDMGSYKVSAKAAKLGKAGSPVSEGGKPGCGPVVNDIFEAFRDGSLDRSLFTKDFIQFIIFIKENVYDPKGIHKTYENLANCLSNPPKWLKINLPSQLEKFTKPGSVNSKNIISFAKIFNKEKQVKTELMNNEVYCDAFRVKYMSQVFIKALNDNDSIIEQFTKAISLLFGVFIQLYIDDNSDFVNGKIRMFGEVVSADGTPLKINGKGYHYEFLDNSSFNTHHQMDNTKLSMRLVQ